jgi:hypothetical protein|tara:strand:+ start:89 stop:1369 length:1281 start_codon:yes stop_codon:yes gene_type:complete
MNKKHIKEEGLRDWFGKSKSKGGKKGWVNVVTGDSCASDKPGEGIPKCVSSSKRASMSKKERVAAQAAKRREDPGQQKKSGASKPTMVKTDRKVRKEEKFVPPYEELKTVAKEKEKKKSRMNAMEVNGALDEAKDKKTKGSGSKDACYHKVKSRYSVWPSAYASGALVKCRKVGAANWGNKSEETEFDSISFQQFQEKCWKGYEKKGMKKMFGKKYPNCVKKEGYAPGDVDQKVGAVTAIPKSEQDAAKARILAKTKAKMKKEEVEHIDEKINPLLKGILKKTPVGEDPKKGGVPYKKTGKMTEAKNGGDNDPCWDTHKKVGMKMKGGKLVNDCRPKNEETEVAEGAAWTKKSGKNKSGGLNEKGRKSYEAENPGSDLKAPSKKKGNKRRASFCARMKGMKAKLTSAKTARDPDSRINKSLRAWNC